MKTEETITIATTTAPGSNAPTKVRATKQAAKSVAKKASKATVAKKRSAKTASKKHARPASRQVRTDTKKAIVLELLRQKQGVTLAEIAKATDWQNHSVRGFIAGALVKKMGIAVESFKSEAGERTYRMAK